jgi:hypothetical protein
MELHAEHLVCVLCPTRKGLVSIPTFLLDPDLLYSCGMLQRIKKDKVVAIVHECLLDTLRVTSAFHNVRKMT